MKDEKIINGINKVRAEFSLIVYYGVILSILIKVFYFGCGFNDIITAGENIIIVAHKGTIQNIVFSWIGMDIAEVSNKNFSIDVKPASISILGVNKWQEHAIFLLNDTSYLQRNGSLDIFNYKFAWR